VQENIKKPLADEMLFGGLVGGGLVFVDVADDALTVTVKAPPHKVISGGNKRAALPAPHDS
jgi:ATP-dependent Clp protease ATP-binding subunit ClpA